jgi:hypothetical protein
MSTPPKSTEWGMYAESDADTGGRFTLRLQWPSRTPEPPRQPSPHAEELKAAWPAKWTPAAPASWHNPVDLSHDADGVTLRAYYGHGGWTWELSADEDHYQGSTNGYSREGNTATAAEAITVLKAALREYAHRLLDLAE